MSDHERIWLEPAPGADEEYGRQWCQHNVFGDEATEYARVDLLEAVIERCAKIADEYSAADSHLRDLARKDKDATGVFVHSAEAATGNAIAASIRAIRSTLVEHVTDETAERETPAPVEHVMGSVPAGYSLVPIDPNDKMMLMGGFSFAGTMPNSEVFPAVRNIWAKMLSKAPQPPPMQDLVYSISRETIAQIIDPTAWEDDTSGMDIDPKTDALRTADSVITYIVRVARRLATASEGSK